MSYKVTNLQSLGLVDAALEVASVESILDVEQFVNLAGGSHFWKFF
jgi:hypothetical protein